MSLHARAKVLILNGLEKPPGKKVPIAEEYREFAGIAQKLESLGQKTKPEVSHRLSLVTCQCNLKGPYD